MSGFEAELGRWWVADEPGASVVGYLDVAKPRGGPWRLTVEGDLAEVTPPGFDTHSTIHGHTASGDYTILRSGTTSTRDGRLIRTQQWRGWQLIKGGHVRPDQRFAHASFRLPELWHWLGPSKLNYHTTARFKADKDSQDNPVWTADLDNGLQLSLAPSFTKRWGDSSESWAGLGIYALHGESGLTLEDLEQVSLALTRLHAIIAGSPMNSFGVTLMNDPEDMSRFEIVDPHPPAGSTWGKRGLKDFFFDTAEIDFPAFITEWISLHHHAMAAVAAAAPRDDRPFVTSKLVDTCNGLETLANYVWPKPDLTRRTRSS